MRSALASCTAAVFSAALFRMISKSHFLNLSSSLMASAYLLTVGSLYSSSDLKASSSSGSGPRNSSNFSCYVLWAISCTENQSRSPVASWTTSSNPASMVSSLLPSPLIELAKDPFVINVMVATVRMDAFTACNGACHKFDSSLFDACVLFDAQVLYEVKPVFLVLRVVGKRVERVWKRVVRL